MKTQLIAKRNLPAWKCSCGQDIPKRGAQLSGDAHSHNGIHIHCPNCGCVVAQYINPKETH